MLSDKFFEVLSHEGVVSIVSWGNDEAHVTNTWNSYVVVTDDKRVLIPAAGLHSTQRDVEVNARVKLTLGSREVEGFNGYQGSGFLLEGIAKFVSSGDEFDMMKSKYPWLSRVLDIKITKSTQLL